MTVPHRSFVIVLLACSGLCNLGAAQKTAGELADPLRLLQQSAIEENRSEAVHWGWEADKYTLWSTHSNRLVPIYTFGTAGGSDGVSLTSYAGANSVYRDADHLRKLYGRLPPRTLNEHAEYLDQTDVFRLQMAGAAAGKKYIFLVVFDGLDWDVVRATSLYNLQRDAYSHGRGQGTHFQDYTAGGTSEFGFMVTSPLGTDYDVDVDSQQVTGVADDNLPGGYDPQRGGATPWERPSQREYLIGRPKTSRDAHAYTDSASSATSMTSGRKTYNGAVNVDGAGNRLKTIAHHLQEQGWAVGAISSVPFCHVTPAASYAHNVTRNDYQDLARDMLGLVSVSHPLEPLPGLDVLIGTGFGEMAFVFEGQGKNFERGNVYLTQADLERINVDSGGRYVVAQRTAGQAGPKLLMSAAQRAAKEEARLFGFFGIRRRSNHLPYQTADGDYQPAPGRNKIAEVYLKSDLRENPTLANMTAAGLEVLSSRGTPFWMLVEAGDVDWANHDNNLDNSIGAVNSGDDAVRVITEWVEANSSWKEAMMIVTSDHGHYLVIERPEMLTSSRTNKATSADSRRSQSSRL